MENCKCLDKKEYFLNCVMCYSTFKGIRTLLKHYAKVHEVKRIANPTGKITCSLFDASCSKNEILEKHLNSVHKLQPHRKRLFYGTLPCDIDLKVFKNEDTNKFQCSLCPKGYELKSKLDEHTAVVHEGKTFKCNECKDVFSWKSSLMTHIKETGHLKP